MDIKPQRTAQTPQPRPIIQSRPSTPLPVVESNDTPVIPSVKTDIPQPKPRPKKKRLPQFTLKWLISIVASVVIIATIFFFVIQWLSVPAHVTKAEFRRALSSRTTDAPVQDTFKVGDPVMFIFSFDRAKVQTAASAELTKDGKVVRTITLPYLRGEASTPETGTRYISLVNGDMTKLEAGTYVLTIKSGTTTLASKKLTIQ